MRSTGVVHHHVDPAECLYYGCHHTCNRVKGRDANKEGFLPTVVSATFCSDPACAGQAVLWPPPPDALAGQALAD